MLGIEQKEREKDTYSVKEFAELIGKDISTVYEWVSKGWIPADTTSGIRILKRDMELVREISVLTGKKYPVVWEGMKKYICSLRDTFENVLERKGRGEVIREISEIVEGKE